MKNYSKLISVSLLTCTILLPANTAFAAAIAAPAPSAPSQPSIQNSSSTQESEQQERFRICFYTQPNYQRRAFCKTAPSRMGILNQKFRGKIQSVKITNYSGQKIQSPDVRLKICNQTRRTGYCETFKSSLKNLVDVFDGSLVSYAFDVKS